MFIAASPDKARSASEKEEMAKKYKPGDQVLPTINTHRTAEQRRADAEDRRLVDEVRELSLQEAGVSSAPPRTRRRRESRSADDRRSSRDRDRGRDQSSEGRHHRGSRRPRIDDGGRHSSDQLQSDGERRRRRSESRRRQIEHQSSIRSLISSGDMSERDIEREIESFARQIQEEGLLDGLDLDNIDLSRDDELSRRITEAYRRRQRDRTRQETRRTNAGNYPPLTRNAEGSGTDSRMLAPEGGRPRERSRPHSRSASAASATSAASQTEERSRQPTSTTSASLEVQEPVRRPRRRTASGGRSSTTPVFPTTTEPRPATRSSTDLSTRPQISDSIQARPAFSEGRSTSTPIHTVPFPNPTDAASSSNNAGNLSFANRQGTTSSASVAPLFSHHEPAAGRSTRPRPVDLAIVHQTNLLSAALGVTNHISNMNFITTAQTGKGCLYWFGFGYGAWAKWEKRRQQQGDPSLPKPHMLTASRYKPPRSAPGGADGRKTLTTDDPRHRLESGTFCAKCYAWTNECYWRCNICNEGDWGFCNDCVNQGRSCTHTLLPLAHESTQPTQSRSGSPPRSPGRPPAATIFKGPNASNIGPFKPLSFTTRCDVCQEPIQPNQARYHCYHCTSSLVSDAAPGDYDICSSCYGNLVTQRQISPENGHSGWRRCLNGHRMVIVAFTEGKVGQWRYVAQDLVGGRGLKSDAAEKPEHRERGVQVWVWHENEHDFARLVTRDVSETAPTESDFTQSFPPEGGIGLKASARFAWYPKAGADDELLFPRGAEIKEIEDVNGEWFFGAYMGSRGLFPAPYVRLEQNT
ncbi:vesicular transport protein [Fusarium heterosporum]|uniref:Vesicular transport protein n=1 Tax=Fusarium heterosporum TaxID=42747 RepID=A0A8H5TI35_FUSHE|nr:vesicular transport protein [Fusarium heterosporum]